MQFNGVIITDPTICVLSPRGVPRRRHSEEASTAPWFSGSRPPRFAAGTGKRLCVPCERSGAGASTATKGGNARQQEGTLNENKKERFEQERFSQEQDTVRFVGFGAGFDHHDRCYAMLIYHNINTIAQYLGHSLVKQVRITKNTADRKKKKLVQEF